MKEKVVLVPMDFHLLSEGINLNYVWRIKDHSLECLSLKTHHGCWLLSAPKLSPRGESHCCKWQFTNVNPSPSEYACSQASLIIDRPLLDTATLRIVAFVSFITHCINETNSRIHPVFLEYSAPKCCSKNSENLDTSSNVYFINSKISLNVQIWYPTFKILRFSLTCHPYKLTKNITVFP